MYKKASKLKLRFATTKGSISVEDLWDLSLEQLDNIAVKLDELLSKQRKSFITVKSNEDTILSLKFDIVKDVINTKLEEKATKENDKIKAAKRQQLLDLIAKKKDAALENKSIEELEKELAELN